MRVSTVGAARSNSDAAWPGKAGLFRQCPAASGPEHAPELSEALVPSRFGLVECAFFTEFVDREAQRFVLSRCRRPDGFPVPAVARFAVLQFVTAGKSAHADH